jgi:hypothetical protein
VAVAAVAMFIYLAIRLQQVQMLLQLVQEVQVVPLVLEELMA